MRRIHKIFLTLVLVLTAIPVVRLLACKGVGEVVPLIDQATPVQAHPGDLVTVTGFQLDAKHVRELYLSGDEVRYQAHIVFQSGTEIGFRVPADVPSGDRSIAVKLAHLPGLVEQPVSLKILEPEG